MAESIASDLAVKILEYLSSSAAEEIGSYFGGRKKLKMLERTMRMIHARLTDAENRCEDEDGALIKVWLRGLKQVLYRLEDLFDEVAIADTRKDERTARKLSKLVCFCISKLDDDLKFNKMVNTEIDGIMRELDGLTSDMKQFNLREFSHNEQLSFSVMKGRETYSFVIEDEIIGRDDDKSAIVRMLLDKDCDGDENLSVIPIVGIGGLGKTTLAQLAYNDKAVQQHFDLKSWACISEISNFQELASKVHSAVKNEKCNINNMEAIQSSLREAVNGRRFLLVLDDVWDEDRENWLQLRCLLRGGKQGSRVIVTTRSQVVASNMATVRPYELKGLSEDKSWELFRSLAFKAKQEEVNPNLSSIGKEIVKKCVNVPLAIRTIAGILYSRDTEEEWRHFKDTDVRKLEQKDNKIMETLKLSYDHLPPQLKQCFAYCSLFPKDYKFYKKRLIWLWMSQGFVKTLDQSQCLEDAGHIYFMELLRRSFFQDVVRDDYGEIVRCKMHDLMHDLACMVGDECHLFDGSTDQYVRDDTNIRHVSFYNIESDGQELTSRLLGLRQLRSFLSIYDYLSSLKMKVIHIWSEMKCLRSLDLGDYNGWSVPIPNSIGELKHLRYLKTWKTVTGLPDGITRLQHMQTLDLEWNHIKELPRGFSKLTNLRHLKLGDCDRLEDMPPGFGELKSLVELDQFIVGKNNGVDALVSMNLCGYLTVHFKERRPNVISEIRAANMKGKKLTSLGLCWPREGNEEESSEEAEEVLKWLQPPTTLKGLRVSRWKGEEFPRWGIDGVPCLLPNLVRLQIGFCDECRRLPTFGRLPNLKYLELSYFERLEYIEGGEGSGCSNSDNEGVGSSSLTPYFPCLEELWLDHVGEVKGWWRRESEIMIPATDLHHCLPRLSILKIWHCPKLKTMVMPGIEYGYLSGLEKLELNGCEELDLVKECSDASIISSSSSSGWRCLSNLRVLSFGNMSKIERVSGGISCLTTLEKLHIRNLKEIGGWIGQLTHLRELKIEDCPDVKELPESITSLSSLTHLSIVNCPELGRRYQVPDGEGRPLIQHIPNVVIFYIRPWPLVRCHS